ncbi:MAG: NUDIX hydrolase [Nanoarchaeota archaeon]
MEIKRAIKFLESKIKNPSIILPEEIFLFISRNIPITNVDLLIKDEGKRTLLAWRDDMIHGKGWHIPGSVIRFKEKMIGRVQKLVKTEIGANVKIDPIPIAINELIHNYKTRGHAISILYKGFLPGKFIPKNKGLIERDVGYLKWHDHCPKNLLKTHEVYRKYI